MTAVVLANRSLFPVSEGWVLRIHHDQHLYAGNCGALLFELQAAGWLELRYMGQTPETPLCQAMLWRMAPVFEEGVDVVFCRDIDALPMPREKARMEAFLASDAVIGAIHDSPYHDGIMGGLCSVRPRELRAATGIHSLDALCAQGGGYETHGADQHLLNKVATGLSQLIEKAPPPDENDPREFLAPHLGSAGFDVEGALAHYDVGISLQRWEGEPFPPLVVLGCDTHEAYSFFIPLTVRMWCGLGFQPLVLLAGTADDWHARPRLRLALVKAREMGARIHFLGNFDSSYSTSTIAQLARLFGSAAPGVRDDDYLLTSDMDMWPIGDWVTKRDDSRAVQLYYANAYDHERNYPAPAHYPICYIGMKAKTWRTMMAIFKENGLRSGLEQVIDYARRSRPEGTRESDWYWNFDEIHFGRQIANWPGYPAECELIRRDFAQPGQGRIDRSNWQITGSLDDIADAHLLRPGFTDENWPRLRPLLAHMSTGRWLDWADEYRKTYVELPE